MQSKMMLYVFQIDVVGLYIIMLVQMITSGLQVIVYVCLIVLIDIALATNLGMDTQDFTEFSWSQKVTCSLTVA